MRTDGCRLTIEGTRPAKSETNLSPRAGGCQASIPPGRPGARPPPSPRRGRDVTLHLSRKLSPSCRGLLGLTCPRRSGSVAGMRTRCALSWGTAKNGLVAVALLSLLVAHGPGSDALAADQARDTFIAMCSLCHGTGGKGDGPSAAGLSPRPADFTNCATMQKESDATLFTIIKRGGQGAGRSTVMPAWGDSLPDGQIRELVSLVRGFCKK